MYIAFWIQMPEHIMLVAAVSGAGGSSRDGLSRLTAERYLYYLPFSHIHSYCSVLVFPVLFAVFPLF